MITISEYRNYRAVFSPKEKTLTEDEFLSVLTQHTRAPSKDSVPLFSPTRLAPVDKDRCKHTRTSKSGSHRCDASVVELTALVFDADQGTDEDIARCHAALTEANYTHVFYSTFSYDPAGPKQAYRLAVLVDRPVTPEEFKGVRASFIAAYAVPCDPKSSAGVSHSYYYPAAPLDGVPRVLQHRGAAAPVDKYVAELEIINREACFVELDSPKHQPPIEALRAECRRYIQRNPGTPTATLLTAMLNGTPLSSAGGRHAAAIELRGKLCGLFTDVDPFCLYELARDSLEAMSDGDRDFSLEFAEGIEEYQDELFARDENSIEKRHPVGMLFPKHPESAAAQTALVEEVRTVLRNRLSRYDEQPDKKRIASAMVEGKTILAPDMNRAVWLLLANANYFPIETYVRLLEPCICESTVGPNRLRQLLVEASYEIEQSNRNTSEFFARESAGKESQ